MVLEGGGGGTAGRSGSGDGRVGMVGTNENSLLDMVFLPELSVLLGLVGGRVEVRVQGPIVCCVYTAVVFDLQKGVWSISRFAYCAACLAGFTPTGCREMNARTP